MIHLKFCAMLILQSSLVKLHFINLLLLYCLLCVVIIYEMFKSLQFSLSYVHLITRSIKNIR